MMLRRAGALLLALLTACGGTRHVGPQRSDAEEWAAVRYELSVLTPRTAHVEPVEVDADDFQEVLATLFHGVRPSERPVEAARQLFGSEREEEFLAQVEDGRIIWMRPLGEGRSSPSRDDVALTREYLRWCEQAHGGGDCLSLLGDGPTVRGEDRYTLALAIALGGVLDEAKHGLRELMDPRAVLATVLGAATVYLLLWMLPEPVSKGLAAALTVTLLAWLGADTLWGLIGGWVRLAEEADRALTFAQLRAAGERYGQVLGQNTARVLVMGVMAALGGTAATLGRKVPQLPGFAQAAARAEAQAGVRLTGVAEVESVAVSSEGAFSVLARSPGGRPGAGPRPAGAVLVRHRGGNQQVALNGQRWHLPASKTVRDIPRSDLMGDQLQAAAAQVALRWGPSRLSFAERSAIREAASQGRHWRAHLLERQARGRFVEEQLKNQFPQLRWNRLGVDAVDPVTGYKYELLSGTDSNLALHGQRMADEFFRMIVF